MPTINLYKSSLCLLNKRVPDKGIDIWIRKEHSFEKLHSVLPGMSTTPLGFRISTELLLEYHENLCEGHDLAYYNLETEQLNGTGIRLARNSLSRYYTDTYVESLVILLNKLKKQVRLSPILFSLCVNQVFTFFIMHLYLCLWGSANKL